MFRTLLVILALLIGATARAEAQSAPADLAAASIEDLMQVDVTSASRYEQRADDVPAAIYVISREDIRRSGMTSIPDLLRLAPGVHVAQINANKWAVSVRGFNSLYSNKLLVMVDGRSIYNPAFAAVLWDTEDLMMEDIDRIEVIRGPGGAMWGANAVNGVINIITRHAAETRGLLARVEAGWRDSTTAAIRYGGLAGPMTYRVYAQSSLHSDSLSAAADRPAGDHWRSLTGGVRADWSRDGKALMMQASFANGQQRPLWQDMSSLDITPLTPTVSETHGSNAVARWTSTLPAGSLQIQGYFDLSHRSEAIGTYDRTTWDADAQYHTRLGARQHVIGGGGYRIINEAITGRGIYAFTPSRATPMILNAFAQDTISMGNVDVTLGGKFESNSVAGSGFQPTARWLWKLRPAQRAWASVSRAVRTPSLIDRGLRVEYVSTAPASPLPVVVGATGNPDFLTEHFADVEGGYRINIGTRAVADVTAFRGRYDDLQTYERELVQPILLQGQPALVARTRYGNLLSATTSGAEASLRLQVTPGWDVDGAVSAFHLTPSAPASTDPGAATYDGRVPAWQWRAHSSHRLGAGGRADLHLFRVGALTQLQIPAYVRLDARLEWRLGHQFTLIANGENLLNAAHLEFSGDETNMIATRMRRSANLQLTWRY